MIETLGNLIFETPPKEKLNMLSVTHPIEALSANVFGTVSPFCEMEIEERPMETKIPMQSPGHFMFKS